MIMSHAMNVYTNTANNFLVVGYTTQDHLLVDLDNCSIFKAEILVNKIQDEYPFLGDALLVRSSDQHYHVVFDDFVRWETLVRIIEVMADLGIVQKNYAQVRTFRRDLTLRISDKKGEDRIRPPPEVIEIMTVPHKCNDHNGIAKYLYHLRFFSEHGSVSKWKEWA